MSRVTPSDESDDRYHRMIVRASLNCALLLSGLSGLWLLYVAWPDAGLNRWKYCLAPFPIFFFVGALSGVAVACLFAPRSFLQGPAGRYWLRIIGSERMILARSVCALVSLLFVVLLAIFVVGFGWSTLL